MHAYASRLQATLDMAVEKTVGVPASHVRHSVPLGYNLVERPKTYKLRSFGFQALQSHGELLRFVTRAVHNILLEAETFSPILAYSCHQSLRNGILRRTWLIIQSSSGNSGAHIDLFYLGICPATETNLWFSTLLARASYRVNSSQGRLAIRKA